MTSNTDFHPHTDTSDPSPRDPAGSTAETARSEAQNVTSSAVESGGQVLETAKSETSEVVSQAGQSARELFDQVRDELTDQAGTQQHRVAGGLRELAEELDRLGQGSDSSGLATSLVKQAGERTRSAAEWIGDREPGDLFAEVRHYAARKPGTFLAAAAALGFLGARFTRGLTAANSSSTSAPRPRPAAAPAPAVYGEHEGDLTPGAAPSLPREVDVPTVTTISHGQPVTYPAAGAGPSLASLPTTVPTPELGTTDDVTQGRA